MSPETIIVNNIKYNYGKIQAVKGITFSVGKGEIFGFLGPNGAGKSTTIKMLTGQLHPQDGEISILGKNIVQDTSRIQAHIGISFERTNLYEQMNAVENLKLFADLNGVKNFDANEFLKKVDLMDRAKDRVSGYSKGMKQRLMVARALVNRPEILFLDEPTEGLDPASAEKIRSVILKERDRGATVFLTTHDMHEADILSDRVAFLNSGEIVALDTPHNLKQKYGKRAVRAQIRSKNGKIVNREIVMDEKSTPDDMHKLFEKEDVITVHSEEASLEDIFIKITGRGLTG